MIKTVAMKNDSVSIWSKYTLQYAICNKSMQLFELYLKKKAFFCFLFIKIRCLINIHFSKLWYLWKWKWIYGLFGNGNGWRATKWVITYDRSSLIVSFIFLWKIHTQNFHSNLLSKKTVKDVRGRVIAITLIK